MKLLTFPPETTPSPHVLAAFTTDDTGVCIVTPDGRLASVGNNFQVLPLDWPARIPNPSELCTLHASKTGVILASKSGRVHCLDIAKKQQLFQCELGFAPQCIESSACERVLIFSSSKVFTILDSQGKLLLRGQGPCAIDSSRHHCMIWDQAYLSLYQLAPFQRLRSWGEAIALPRSLGFSADSSRALSLDEQGEYKVWEVDEANRVYERHLLVTAGASYDELIRSFEAYSRSLLHAETQYKSGRFHAAYVSLQSARSITGFQQAEKALQLQWNLCRKLQREALQAVWERLYISDVVSGQLDSDCQHLLIATASGVELSHLSASKISRKFLTESARELIGARYFLNSKNRPILASISSCGHLEFLCPDRGGVTVSKDLGLGPLSFVRFYLTLALIYTRGGDLVTLDLDSKRLLSQIPLGKRRLDLIFAMGENKATLVTSKEHIQADIRTGELRLGLPLALGKLPGQISFVGDIPSSKLRMTGFSDGTLVISQTKDGQSLFAINQENGPVTGAVVHMETALGVSVSAEGGITLFDLSSGRVLDRFVAHADGVKDISISQDGRYLTTQSITGQFRLWEISWALSEHLGCRKIDWLQSTGLGKFFGRK